MYKKEELLLRAKDINLSFPDPLGKGNKQILSNINFDIYNIKHPDRPQGQVVSLIGRSGSGKTQLLRILSGLTKPTSGEVFVNKEQTHVVPGDMGVVPQDYYMFPWRKVRSILERAASKNPVFRDDDKLRKDAIDHYIDAFELTNHVGKYPAQLSGGQRQRVSISQQLLNGSNFLLMDEPFSGLDSLMIDKTINIITSIVFSDEIKTIIIVSHDLTNTVCVSDTVLVLSQQGREPNTGASIIKEICLMDLGLAWDPSQRGTSKFNSVINNIKSLI